MTKEFRSTMSSLHSWVGLVFGWMLFFIFVTGTLGYFDTEIDRWMQPELPQSKMQAATLEQTQKILAHLNTEAQGAKSWSIHFPTDRNKAFLEIWWQDAQEQWHNQKLSDEIEPLIARDTGGGQLLYKMHWKFHYLPRWASDPLVGIAASFLFFVLITGVVLHKHLFKNPLRFKQGTNYRSWLDGHKLIGVVGLPFHFMIAYSGLLFMMFIYFPWIISSFYGAGQENKERMFDDIFSAIETPVATGKKSELVDFSLIWKQLEQKGLHDSIAFIEVLHPHDENSQIKLYSANENMLSNAHKQWVFHGVSAEYLAHKNANETLPQAIRDLFLALHEGLFANTFVRWLYFLFGLLGSAMIATGLILWIKKRQKKQIKMYGALAPGSVVVERLNVATIVGLISAIGVYFAANRFLPLDLPERAQWEVHLMFLTWVLLFVHAFVQKRKRLWGEQLFIGGVIFLSLPILSALYTKRPLWVSVMQGDTLFVTIELLFMMVGALFFYLARKIYLQSYQV